MKNCPPKSVENSVVLERSIRRRWWWSGGISIGVEMVDWFSGADDDLATTNGTTIWTEKRASNWWVYENEQGQNEDGLRINQKGKLRRLGSKGREETRITMHMSEEDKDFDCIFARRRWACVSAFVWGFVCLCCLCRSQWTRKTHEKMMSSAHFNEATSKCRPRSAG